MTEQESTKLEALNDFEKVKHYFHEVTRYQELLKMCKTQQQKCQCNNSYATRTTLLLEIYLTGLEHYLDELQYSLLRLEALLK